MQPTYYIPLIVLLIVLLPLILGHRLTIARKIIKNKKTGDKTKMIELAKRFIGKECLIYSFDGNRQYEGTIKEVTNGGVLIEKDGKLEVINLDFVIRIREYPKNKNGKKKSVVLD